MLILIAVITFVLFSYFIFIAKTFKICHLGLVVPIEKGSSKHQEKPKPPQ